MILIDPPNAAGHGRMWSHLASDESADELHAFARTVGVPERGYDRDHYDVPAEWYDRLVEAGATPVTSRELARRLVRGGLRRRKAEVLRPRSAGRPLVRPPALAEGSRVALVSPAGPTAPERIAAGVAVLEGWGLTVTGPDVDASAAPLPWLADADEARAAALQAAWTDPEVAAVITVRGGYGSQRMLDLLDWAALAEAGPKLLVGFSDITALHQAFAARLGVVTVHGPGAGSVAGDHESAEALRRLLFTGEAGLTGLTTAVPGTATGPLVGGNVTMLASGIGTLYTRPAAGSIVLLEDVGERPYRLDRSLTQLIRSGWFADVAGVVCGDFTDCGDVDQVRSLLTDRLDDLGVPVAHAAPVGHGPRNLALPLGVRAVLDADAGTLVFSEPAVR